MTNNISKIIFVFFALLTMASCKKFLDQVPDNLLKEEDIFKTYNNTNGYLAQVYANIPDEFSSRFARGSNYSGPWTGAADEANYWSLSWVMSNALNQSTWHNNTGGTYWTNFYKPVRTATDFIAKIDDATAPDITALQKMRFKAEARALRAIF